MEASLQKILSFANRTKCQNEFHFFENITPKQNKHVQKLPNMAATREHARFGFRRFLDNLEKSTSKHPPKLETSSARMVVTGRARNALSHVEQGKSARQHVRGTRNAMRHQARHELGELIWQNVEINTNTKAKLKSQTNIRETKGKAGRFRRKNGEIRHIHIRRKEKITREKL